MAHDWFSNRTVLHRYGPEGGESWVFDGYSWTVWGTQDTLNDGEPGGRSGHSMAYHAGYGSVVLFGGLTNAQYTNDLWRFDVDDASWEAIDPGTGPSLRVAATMAYDARRSELVVFGGLEGTGLAAADTWIWHAKEGVWEPIAGPAPPARFMATMHYDPLLDRIILFGGIDDFAVPKGDTWEWDGDSQKWSPAAIVDTDGAPGGEPDPSAGAVMTYSHDLGRLLLRGGSSDDPKIWSWRGQEWTVDYDAGGGAELGLGPTTLMTQSSDGLIVVNDSGTFGVDADYTVTRKTLGVLQHTTRRNHGMAFVPDGPDRNAVVFGGYGATGSPKEYAYQNAGEPGLTFGWDGQSWANISPAGFSPDWRSSHAMAGDLSRSMVVMFGGWLNVDLSSGDPVPILSNETFEWDGTQWSMKTPVESPPARMKHMMVYDEVAQTVLIFGGVDAAGDILNDTWEWIPGTGDAGDAGAGDAGDAGTNGDGGAAADGGDGGAAPGDPAVLGTWIRHDDGPARLGADMAWHSSCQCVVLFGGRERSVVLVDGELTTLETRTSDTFTWVRDRAGPQWLQLNQIADPDGDLNPDARSEHRLVYDEQRDVTVLLGGRVGQIGSGYAVSQTWEFELLNPSTNPTGNWRRVYAPTIGDRPIGGDVSGYSLEYDPISAEPLAFGGRTNIEMHVLTSADRTPFLNVSFDMGTIAADATIETLDVYSYAGGDGYLNAVADTGATLLVWQSSSGWKTVASNDATTDSPDALNHSIVAPELSVLNGQVYVTVRPKGGNLTSAQPATVALDYIELYSEYSLPAQ
jgi:hypothetical protein